MWITYLLSWQLTVSNVIELTEHDCIFTTTELHCWLTQARVYQQHIQSYYVKQSCNLFATSLMSHLLHHHVCGVTVAPAGFLWPQSALRPAFVTTMPYHLKYHLQQEDNSRHQCLCYRYCYIFACCCLLL